MTFKAEEAATYDQAAERFAALSDLYSGDLAARLVDLAGIKAGDRVLDVGTGAGVVARAAAERAGAAGRVMGIDISPKMVAHARERAAAQGLGGRLEYRVMDAENLDLDAAAFDVVVSLFALLHLPTPLRALTEMRRVLRPEGRLVVGVGSGAPLSARGIVHRLGRLRTLWSERRGQRLTAPRALESLLALRMGPDAGASAHWEAHAREHHPEALHRLVVEAGFADVQCLWQGRDVSVSTPEEFWDLQATFSSPARRRLADAAPAVVDGLRRELVERAQAVLARRGSLVYPQGVLFLCALRPAS